MIAAEEASPGAWSLPMKRRRARNRCRRIGAGRLVAGVSLAELEKLMRRRLAQHGAAACVRRVDGCPAREWGADSRLPAPLLVNCLRHVQGRWTGHWMLTAVAVETEAGRWVLLLDPAAHKLGPHWLPEDILTAAMCTRNYRGELRGYLAVDVERNGGT